MFSLWNSTVEILTTTMTKGFSEEFDHGHGQGRHDGLVDRLKAKWKMILNKEYVVKICMVAWDRLRRVVDAYGGYLKPNDLAESSSDNEDND